MLRLINDAGLEPRLLTVELTSGIPATRLPIVAALDELREAGVGVALDDFGMATSLADLKRLPVDQVKLAREFVGAINGPAEDSAFRSVTDQHRRRAWRRRRGQGRRVARAGVAPG